MTRNYQISIPAEIRKRLNIKLGNILEVHYDEEKGGDHNKKIQEQRKTLKLGRKLSPDEIEGLIEGGLRENL